MKSFAKPLVSKANSNLLEVEHLINAVVESPCEETAQVIEKLCSEHNWQTKQEVIATNSMLVPLASWAKVCIAFARHGHPAVLDLALENELPTELFPFSISIFEAEKSQKSVFSLASLCLSAKQWKADYGQQKRELASAINTLLSFKSAPSSPPEASNTIREFLHMNLCSQLDENDLATYVCALRGVGNESSIEIINNGKKLPRPWKGTEKIVIKAIQANLENAV